MPAAPTRPTGWLTGWDPEDERAWHDHGRFVARRNLAGSVLTEHIGFSVWTLWSVLVLFMTPELGYHHRPGELFLLVTTPTVVGALLRLPYSRAVVRFGGRTWTVVSTLALTAPTLLAAVVVARPRTPMGILLVVAALTGVGGATFASSMTNVAAFYPNRAQGWALGVNAGGGNLGVAAVQLAGLAVVGVAGPGHPELLAYAYLPLIVIATVVAARRMDNVAAVRSEPGALRDALRHPDTWWISLLYIGTFGSFIGYGFAFGLVLRHEFGASPRQAVAHTILGPLLGALCRPLGGLAADRWGGARVTLWTFLGLAAGTTVLIGAAAAGSFGLFVAGFTALFVLSGIGNGSTYRMIPAAFTHRARTAVRTGAADARAWARRLSAAVIALAGAVGALGGAAINLCFKAAYARGSGIPAFLGFLGYYALCVAVLRLVYLRRKRPDRASEPARETSHV
ncbi:MFS transporter [Actinoplanes sp. NPDC049265]|uniref:MFS transporter n=1 Tax=Actinoplanes sp. NPDC049265 TaxID=3363902 RepID=UPI0037177E24